MKKLLGLLGTIMITGNAIPSVIAAAPNRKHNIKKRQLPPSDKDIPKKENSQQEMQNLIEINNNIILGKEYKFLIKNIINELCEKNIINELLYVNKNKNEIYETNSDNKYFILNLKLDNETVSVINEEEITETFIKKIDNNKNNIYNIITDSINENNIINEKINLKIILSDNDFYLQGFINNENKYFYFKDSKLKKLMN